jgi:hypothetical protein
MIDSLPEGVIVLHEGKIQFINDLAQKLMCAISGMKHFGDNFMKDSV